VRSLPGSEESSDGGDLHLENGEGFLENDREGKSLMRPKAGVDGADLSSKSGVPLYFCRRYARHSVVELCILCGAMRATRGLLRCEPNVAV
jgi:hypothetical protein